MKKTKDAVNTLTQKIRDAWTAYQPTETRGLKLGQACCEYRDANKSKGGCGSKGKGLLQKLEELTIPVSTAYYWMSRFEGKTNFNPAGTRGYKGKPKLNLFLRRLMAIGAVGITSPFPSMVDDAFHECNSREAAEAIIFNLDAAIKRLTEYRAKFKEIQNA